MQCRCPRSQNICAFSGKLGGFAVGVTAAFMKFNWMRSRSSKPQNGSRNIASSGKARSTAWLSIWKKQTKLWPRKEISNHVSRMLRQSRFGRNRRDFEWRVDHTRALESSLAKEKQGKT